MQEKYVLGLKAVTHSNIVAVNYCYMVKGVL